MTTVLLVRELIKGGGLTDSARELLLTGIAVWSSNIVVFALLYWEVDGGGSVARALRRSDTPTSPSRNT